MPFGMPRAEISERCEDRVELSNIASPRFRGKRNASQQCYVSRNALDCSVLNFSYPRPISTRCGAVKRIRLGRDQMESFYRRGKCCRTLWRAREEVHARPQSCAARNSPYGAGSVSTPRRNTELSLLYRPSAPSPIGGSGAL